MPSTLTTSTRATPTGRSSARATGATPGPLCSLLEPRSLALRVLHLIRAAGDTLAWDAVRARGPGDEVRVVLLQEAVGDMPPADLKDVAVGLLLPRGRRSAVGG